MRRLLLDVNVWVAALNENHERFTEADGLLGSGLPLATCPIVENGVLRVLNTPAVRGSGPSNFTLTRGALRRARDELDLEFWPDDRSLVTDDLVDWTRLHGHAQLTDAYLLALAVANDAALGTFDQRVSLQAVRGATADHLVIVGAT